MVVSPFLPEAMADTVDVTADELIVRLTDGRRLAVPLAWFPTLCNASETHRSHWELLGDGEGIHWPDLDADISIEGLLFGVREVGTSG